MKNSIRLMLLGIFMLVVLNCFDFMSYRYESIEIAKICIYGSIIFGVIGAIIFLVGFVMSFLNSEKSKCG